MVLILCVIVTVMLWLFFLYHMYLVYQGYTTSESVKASQIIYYLEKSVKFLLKWEKLATEKKPFKPAQKSLDYYEIEKADMKLADIKQLLKLRREQLYDMKKGSPYRFGFWRSLYMIAFPEKYEKELMLAQ